MNHDTLTPREVGELLSEVRDLRHRVADLEKDQKNAFRMGVATLGSMVISLVVYIFIREGRGQ